MNIDYKYDVALSFAGEDREYVEDVALQLKGYGVKVFYDKFEEENLWGKNLYYYLREVYTENAKFTIMFISKSYKEKLWTNHERESMQERAFESASEYILPVRFDDTKIPGLQSTTGYIGLNGKDPSYLVSLVLKKIGWQLNKRWWGRWEVETVSSALSSLLEISEVSKSGFTFTLSTIHGAHTGEVAGEAIFLNENEASYNSGVDENDICKITFRKSNDVIQVSNSVGCWRYHGMRAYFTGDYRLKKDSFYDRVVVSDVHLSSIYKLLGEKHWPYFVNCFSDIHKPENLDSSATEVMAGGIPGLYTICESILMVNRDNLWGAFLEDNIVYFFTNTNRKELPNTIVKWKEKFNEKKVTLLTG